VFARTQALPPPPIFSNKTYIFLFLSTTYNTFFNIKSLKVSTRFNEHGLIQEHSLSFINLCLHFSYGLTRAIFFPFLACNFSLRIFSDSHKSNSNSCLGLQVISKRKLGSNKMTRVYGLHDAASRVESCIQLDMACFSQSPLPQVESPPPMWPLPSMIRG
jgi:hypothetical protein